MILKKAHPLSITIQAYHIICLDPKIFSVFFGSIKFSKSAESQFVLRLQKNAVPMVSCVYYVKGEPLSPGWFSCRGRIEIWKCWIFRREILGTLRAKQKLKTNLLYVWHISSEFDLDLVGRGRSLITTVPSLLPKCLKFSFRKERCSLPSISHIHRFLYLSSKVPMK